MILSSRTEHEKKRAIEMRGARHVFIQTLGLNVAVAAAKLGWGFYSQTLTMIADGFHSLLDASSNILGIVGLTISLKPPDEGHPYGHRKFEALAAIGISFMMFLSSFEVLTEAIKRMSDGSSAHPTASPAAYAIMVVTLAVNYCVSKYESRKGKELSSKLLLSDSQHTMSDIYASLTVILSLVAIQFRYPLIDAIGSCLIVLIIFRAGYGIIMSHLGTLVDAAILDAKFVERLVTEVPGVTSCHKIRSRGVGDQIFIDLHVQVPRHFSIEQAHSVSFAVEEKLRQAAGGNVDVLVHIEDDSPPYGAQTVSEEAPES